MEAPSSHLVRRLGPGLTAFACVVTWASWLHGPHWMLQKAASITAPEVAMLGIAGAMTYLLGYVFYALYRATIYIKILEMHDRRTRNTARSDLIKRYYYKETKTNISTKDADYLFRIAMVDVPHNARRLELSDSVHFLYQSCISVLVFAISSCTICVTVHPARYCCVSILQIAQYVVLPTAFYCCCAILLFSIGWMTNNYVELEERILVKDNISKFDKAARANDFVRSPNSTSR